jgi:hypothetical protein
MTSLEDGSKTEFRLWFEQGSDSGLPIRFEYRARAFLHLAFEHDPSLTEPAMIHLEEHAQNRARSARPAPKPPFSLEPRVADLCARFKQEST